MAIRLCLFLFALLVALPLAAQPTVSEAFKLNTARLVIAWDEPVEVQRQPVAEGFVLTASRPLPDLGGAARRLPEALGRLKALDAQRLQLVPSAGVAAHVRVEKTRRLVITFVRHDDKPEVDSEAHGQDSRSVLEEVEPGLRIQARQDPTLEAKAARGDRKALPFLIDRLPIEVEAVEDGLDLRFAWGRPVPAAAFVRGRDLWVTFAGLSRSIAAERSNFAAEGKGLIRGVRQQPHDTATVLRFTLEHPLQGHMESADDGWTLKLRAAAQLPEAVNLRRSPERAALSLAGAGDHAMFLDPHVGDRLHVVMLQAGRQATPAGDFVDFEALPALQGAVFRPKIERLEVEIAEGSVLIGRPGGLRLDGGLAETVAEAPRQPAGDSAPTGPEPAPSVPVPPPPPTGIAPSPDGLLFGFGTMLGYDEPLGVQTRAAMRTLERDTGQGRAQRWRNLARMYLARNLPEEAQALLEGDETPEAAALRAAALLLMDRPDAAAEEFKAAAGKGSPELGLWQGMLAARQERWGEAHALLDEALSLVETYPPPLQFEALRAATQAALGVGETGRAFDLIRGMKAFALDAEGIAERKLLEAAAQDQEGAEDDALALWGEVMLEAPLAQRTQAAALLADALLRAGEVDAAGAAALLGKEAVLWHGLKHEARLLEQLAGYEASAGRYGQALARLDRARDLVSKDEDERLSNAMRAALNAALGPDGPAPLEQLLILRRHRGLFADDPNGQDAIRTLSERLTQAGFEGVAEDLGSVTGEAVTASSAAEDDVERFEALLRKRRFEEARRVLEGMTASNLERAVAAAFAAQDWKGVVHAARPLVGALDPGTELRPSDRLLLLRLAVALAREKNVVEIQNLAERFASTLKEQKDADLLALLADRSLP